MSDVVIKAENISKQFQLGEIGTGSLRQDINHWWQKNILKKDNIFYATDQSENSHEKGNQFWALKDVSFEIKEGETWGIIGRNGSGKSTLLKILSRIIKPTYGTIKGRGKISSLLEVGTGFHPELTGRENIFISGHMLGMNKQEILKKFDEIVDFSGIGAFIDTPVKRYSSGMYVRLAFSVAAHLEPDILIVDEVLAVGDTEFQKKCISKLNDASGKEGRTVIFVSHNVQAISNLCSNAILLEKGNVAAIGNIKPVMNSYLGALQKQRWLQTFNTLKEAPGNELIRLIYIELIPQTLTSVSIINITTPIKIKFKFHHAVNIAKVTADLLLFNTSGECIFDLASEPFTCNKGFIEGECIIPGNFLNDGVYYFTLYFAHDASTEKIYFEECLLFEVADFNENASGSDKWWGLVRPNFPFTLNAATNSKSYC